MSVNKLTSYVSTQSLNMESPPQSRTGGDQVYAYSPDVYKGILQDDLVTDHRQFQDLESGQVKEDYSFFMKELDEMEGDLEDFEGDPAFDPAGIPEEQTESQDLIQEAAGDAADLKKDRELFEKEVKWAKMELKATIDCAMKWEEATKDTKATFMKLDEETKAALIKKYHDQADALLQEEDLDFARAKLEQLSQYLSAEIPVKFEEAKIKAIAIATANALAKEQSGEKPDGEVTGGY